MREARVLEELASAISIETNVPYNDALIEKTKRILTALSSAGLAVVPVTDADLIDNSYLSLIKAETERDDLLTAALDVEADLIAYMLVHAADYSSAGPSVEQYKEMIAKLRAGIGAQGGTK